MDFWINLIFYVSGALSYSFLSRLFNAHHAARIFGDLQQVMLSYIAIVDLDFRKTTGFKLSNLRQAGATEQDLAMVEEVDNEILETWKQTIITRVLIECPRSMQNTRQYRAWESLLSADLDVPEEEE